MPKLAKRLFLYFSAALIVFTIVLAGLFDTLMRDASIKENRALLENRTRALAASLTEESAAQAPAPAQENRRGMSGRQRGMHMRGMHHADNTAENSSNTSSNSYCRRYVSDAGDANVTREDILALQQNALPVYLIFTIPARSF